MNKKKYNILILVALISFLLCLGIAAKTYMGERNNVIHRENELREECFNRSEEERKKLIEEGYPFCKPQKEGTLYTDFFTTFTNIVVVNLGSKFVMIFFLVIVSLSLYYTSRYLKYNILSYDLNRRSYKKIKRDFFIQAYKPILIMIIVILVAYVISIVYLKAGLNGSYSLENSTSVWEGYTLLHPILFMIFYLLNIIVHFTLFINISLIIVRKNHNYVVAIILSFLLYIGLEAFLEIFLGWFIGYVILKKDLLLFFNIFNFLAFNNSKGFLNPLVIPTILVIITSFIVSKLYKNKEKLVIECEKN